LYDAIEHEHVSVRVGLEDEQVLVERFFYMEDLVDGESHGLAGPKELFLSEPAI
jgi:hypothetical protein